MKVIYINVFNGCKDSARFRNLINFVKKADPDVLGLSELNGWDYKDFTKLRRFKRETGIRYSAYLKSSSGSSLALLSKTPLRKARVLQGKMWHGVVIAEIKAKGLGCRVAVTHLAYQNEDRRLVDVSFLLGALGAMRKTILIGDMNSISPTDAAKPEPILKRLRKAGIAKFGTDGLRTDVIRELLTAGLIDSARLSRKSPGRSVPTKSNTDFDHAVPLRLDYTFVTKDLKSRVRSAQVVRTRLTDRISDHYPVLLDLA